MDEPIVSSVMANLNTDHTDLTTAHKDVSKAVDDCSAVFDGTAASSITNALDSAYNMLASNMANCDAQALKVAGAVANIHHVFNTAQRDSAASIAAESAKYDPKAKIDDLKKVS